MTERTGRDLDSWYPGMSGMARQMSTVVIKGLEPFLRKKSALCQHRVECSASVPLTEDEPVSIGPVGPLRIHAQNPRGQDRKQFGHRKGGANMGALGAVYHLYSRQTSTLG